MSGAMGQADLDTLLGTLHPTPPDGAPSHSAASPSRREDFSHPELLTPDQIRTLRTVHEGFAQALAKKLSTELLANLSASVVSIDALTYADFLMPLPAPTVLSVIEIPELDGKIAIELHPAIAFAFIDRLLGGSGVSISQVRPLTAIEQGLMERILAKCCAELDAAWSPIFPLTFQLQSIEANPELARVVEPSEMVVLIAFEIRMNEVSAKLHLCLPYVVMEPALNRLSQGADAPRGARIPGQARQALERSLEECTVSVDVDLACVEVSFHELLHLQSGDVLPFSLLSESGASVSLLGIGRLEGKPGRSRGHRAFQVVSRRFDSERTEENRA